MKVWKRAGEMALGGADAQKAHCIVAEVEKESTHTHTNMQTQGHKLIVDKDGSNKKYELFEPLAVEKTARSLGNQRA